MKYVLEKVLPSTQKTERWRRRGGIGRGVEGRKGGRKREERKEGSWGRKARRNGIKEEGREVRKAKGKEGKSEEEKNGGKDEKNE